MNTLLLMHLLAALFFSLSTVHGQKSQSFESAKVFLGNVESDKAATFTVTTGENSAKVQFEVVNCPKVVDSTIYFANDKRSILEIVVTAGSYTPKFFETPYNQVTVEGMEPKPDETLVPEGYTIEIMNSWFPLGVTRVSGSYTCQEDDNTQTIINYYSLHNVGIALPDLYVVENYLKTNIFSV